MYNSIVYKVRKIQTESNLRIWPSHYAEQVPKMKRVAAVKSGKEDTPLVEVKKSMLQVMNSENLLWDNSQKTWGIKQICYTAYTDR